MIRVVIEVWNEATSSSVVARARTLREAASIAAAVYPNAEVRVKFPIDAEAFFVRDPAAREEIVSVLRLRAIGHGGNGRPRAGPRKGRLRVSSSKMIRERR
jgi:hypothetical protein